MPLVLKPTTARFLPREEWQHETARPVRFQRRAERSCTDVADGVTADLKFDDATRGVGHCACEGLSPDLPDGVAPKVQVF